MDLRPQAGPSVTAKTKLQMLADLARVAQSEEVSRHLTAAQQAAHDEMTAHLGRMLDELDVVLSVDVLIGFVLGAKFQAGLVHAEAKANPMAAALSAMQPKDGPHHAVFMVAGQLGAELLEGAQR